MLKKKNRLSKVNSFVQVKKIEANIFTIKISDKKDTPKFAFIVSKKIDKSAVVRNRIKRFLKKGVSEILRKVLEREYLIIAKKDILGKDQVEINKQINRVFEEQKLIK